MILKTDSQNHLRYRQTLPGIGESTAGAIMSIAYQIPYPILDANVKRVISRYESVDNNMINQIKNYGLYLVNILQIIIFLHTHKE